MKGIRLAIAETNQNGGILGRPIELAIVDNKNEPETALQATVALTDQKKVAAVIGALTSTKTLAAAKAAEERGIALVSPTASSPQLTVDSTGKIRRWVFRGALVDPVQGAMLSSFVTDQLKLRNAVVVTDASSVYSRSVTETFKQAFTSQGGQVLAECSYLQRDEDFTRQLEEIQERQPEVVVMPGYYWEAAKFVRQARERGMTMPIVGGNGWNSQELFALAGTENLKNCYFYDDYSPQDPSKENKRFIAAFENAYAIKPTAFSALAYDTTNLVLAAIRQANSDEPRKVRDALETVRSNGILGPIEFDKNHNPVIAGVILSAADNGPNFFCKVQVQKTKGMGGLL